MRSISSHIHEVPISTTIIIIIIKSVGNFFISLARKWKSLNPILIENYKFCKNEKEEENFIQTRRTRNHDVRNDEGDHNNNWHAAIHATFNEKICKHQSLSILRRRTWWNDRKQECEWNKREKIIRRFNKAFLDLILRKGIKLVRVCRVEN